MITRYGKYLRFLGYVFVSICAYYFLNSLYNNYLQVSSQIVSWSSLIYVIPIFTILYIGTICLTSLVWVVLLKAFSVKIRSSILRHIKYVAGGSAFFVEGLLRWHHPM